MNLNGSLVARASFLLTRICTFPTAAKNSDAFVGSDGEGLDFELVISNWTASRAASADGDVKVECPFFAANSLWEFDCRGV